ncbi:acetyl-CoA carboxylase biotin carboxylase subunit family protein [Bradyrhizobium sp. CCBAU 51765]|uniref:ATP-grasp domain-containing protein n=1 Tax=Bradyrhizobium sp. CCBAU 51765 TaxID=1325102 RepID=UPI001888F073|nr:acetyl-CoA carboxylase biotin carboxylase subunit family protein [Bradyrhizobium sp. CCBAU 51765]QOZ11801.1 hypothetical protein XH96_33215 [Bradyrhizobium sp. CCBAU 51765]
MTKRALILVEGNINSTGLEYVQAAQRLGLHPINLSTDPDQYEYLAAHGIETIRIDTNNLDALISECSRLRATYDIAGITGAREAVCATVGKLCRSFNLPGPNPTSIERCCDKFTQRQLLAQAGIAIPAYRLALDLTEVESAAAEIGLPVILKPAVGIGSYGVRLCRDVDELAEHTTYLLGGQHIWHSSPRILVEEFAQGPYYGTDMMGNEIIHIAAADFGPPPHFLFHEYTLPAPLSDDDQKRISDLSRDCLRALDLGWGPAAIEFRWTKRGPVVIEVNPRLVGGIGPRTIQLAYGIDLITEHIKLVIGEQWDVSRRYTQTAGARLLYADRDGTLDWIDGESRAAALPGVAEVKFYIEPNTPIVRKGDHRDRIGHVIAASPSLAQTEAILQRAAELIRWSITPSTAPGGQKTCSTSPRATNPGGAR